MANKSLQRAVRRAFAPAEPRFDEVSDGIDEPVSLVTRTGETRLRGRWVGAGWPKEVEIALREVGENGPWPVDLFLAARRFSPGSRTLLERRGASWVDESGAAQVIAPGLIVFRDGQAEERARETKWSSSSLEIAELLLSRSWPEGFGTTELANLSGWSAPQVSQVLTGFDDAGWTSKYGPGRGKGAKRELADAERLLQSWSEALGDAQQEPREASRAMTDPLVFLREELAAALSERVRWAAGGWAAAAEAAPFASAVPTLQVYVHEDDVETALPEAIASAGLRPVSEGGRVQFLPASAGVLSRSWEPGEVPLASAPRIFADLCRLGPRGREAAEHLKEEVIDPLHRSGESDAGPSEGLIVFERETEARLRARFRTHPNPAIDQLYRFGTYSATYRLLEIADPPSLAELKAILQESAGRETGWPAWLVPERPRSYENAVEAWLNTPGFEDPAHADFWRADPTGRLCLIRGYDEDEGGERAPEPGTVIDVAMPVWRVGECLRHAGRMAPRLGASRIEFMMRWSGLEGRRLTSGARARRRFSGEYECHRDSVTSFVEVRPGQIEPELPRLVRELVAPLLASFESFELPIEAYAEEIEEMRAHARRPD